MSEAVRPEQLRPADAGALQLQRNGAALGGGRRVGVGMQPPQQQQQMGRGARTLAVTSVGAFTEPDSLDSPGPDTARARAMQSQLLHDPNLLMQQQQQQQPQLYAFVQPTSATLALEGGELDGAAYPEAEDEGGHYSPLPSDFERPASQIMRPTAPLPSQQSAHKQPSRQQPAPLVAAQAPSSRQQQQQQQPQQPLQKQVSRSAAAFVPNSQPSQTITRSAAAPAPAPASNRFGSGSGVSGASNAKRAPAPSSSSLAQWMQQQQNGFDLDSGLVGSESLASVQPETEQHYASTRIVPLQPSTVPAHLSTAASNQRFAHFKFFLDPFVAKMRFYSQDRIYPYISMCIYIKIMQIE